MRSRSRALFGLICLLIALTGVGNLFRHRLTYLNYKGFEVFAPFAIVVGCLGMAIAIWKPTFFADSREKQEHQPISPTHGRRKRK
jgi:hypothetical protein